MTPSATFHRGEGPAPRPTDWNLPNALTVLRFLLVPVYGILLFLDGGSDPWWRFWAFVVFAVAAVTDGVDGKLARRRGEITNFGKVADPIADKALTGTAFIGLSVLGVVWWWVTVVILVREVAITVLRFVVIRHGVMPAGRGGKLKTMLQTLSLGALTFPLWVLPFGRAWTFAAYVILGAALVMTVVSGVDYVFKAARLRETSERTRARRDARAAARDARRDARAEAVGGRDPVAEARGDSRGQSTGEPIAEQVDRLTEQHAGQYAEPHAEPPAGQHAGQYAEPPAEQYAEPPAEPSGGPHPGHPVVQRAEPPAREHTERPRGRELPPAELGGPHGGRTAGSDSGWTAERHTQPTPRRD